MSQGKNHIEMKSWIWTPMTQVASVFGRPDVEEVEGRGNGNMGRCGRG